MSVQILNIPPDHHESGGITIEPWAIGGGMTLVWRDPHNEGKETRIGVTTHEAVKVAQALITTAWRMGGQGTIS